MPHMCKQTIYSGFRRWAHHSLLCARHIPALLLLAWVLISTAPAGATPNPSKLSRMCDTAAQQASQLEGVPVDVLRAITRAETGLRQSAGQEPWPWTVNMEGSGRWFDTREQAKAFVFAHFKKGARSFDVGCFQVNYKWHGHAFRSIDDMFDPVLNARYAARFLNDLYLEFGNWSDAAGAYHSRSPDLAMIYAARIDAILNRMSDRSTVPDVSPGNINTGPTELFAMNARRSPLRVSGETTAGSLFPLAPGHLEHVTRIFPGDFN